MPNLTNSQKIIIIVSVIFVFSIITKFIGGGLIFFILLAFLAYYGLKNTNNSPWSLTTNGLEIKDDIFTWQEIKTITATPKLVSNNHGLSALKANICIEKNNGQKQFFSIYTKQAQKLETAMALYNHSIIGLDECVRQYNIQEEKNKKYMLWIIIGLVVIFAIPEISKMLHEYPTLQNNQIPKIIDTLSTFIKKMNNFK